MYICVCENNYGNGSGQMREPIRVYMSWRICIPSCQMWCVGSFLPTTLHACFLRLNWGVEGRWRGTPCTAHACYTRCLSLSHFILNLEEALHCHVNNGRFGLVRGHFRSLIVNFSVTRSVYRIGKI